MRQERALSDFTWPAASLPTANIPADDIHLAEVTSTWCREGAFMPIADKTGLRRVCATGSMQLNADVRIVDLAIAFDLRLLGPTGCCAPRLGRIRK